MQLHAISILVPGVVSNLTATALGSKSVVINWMSPAHPHGVIGRYSVRLQDVTANNSKDYMEYVVNPVSLLWVLVKSVAIFWHDSSQVGETKPRNNTPWKYQHVSYMLFKIKCRTTEHEMKYTYDTAKVIYRKDLLTFKSTGNGWIEFCNILSVS